MEKNSETKDVTMEENRPVRVAAVADIHVRENDRGKWVEYFKDVSRNADVLIIGGDLTDTGDEGEAQVLADELKVIQDEHLILLSKIGN